MAYETKENSGSMFKNDRKEKDTHPDRTGGALIGGVHYWVSGWVKTDKNGKQYMSLAFKRKDEKADKPAREEPQERARGSMKDYADDDTEIPF